MAHCGDVSVGPSVVPVEISWCGELCEDVSGLRYAVSDVEKLGFLFNNSFTGYFISANVDTSYYADCLLNDGFVQSISPVQYGLTEYSVYSFIDNYADSSLLSEGILSLSESSLTYTSNEAELDMSSSTHLLVGPKALIFYGLSGPVEYTQFYKQGTETEWSSEAGTILDIGVSSTAKGIDPNTPMFDVALEDRGATHTVNSLLSSSLHTDFTAVCEITPTHLAVLKLNDAGGSYDVYLAVYEFNFTTKLLDEIETQLLWTGEPNPPEFAFSTNRLVFIPTWGTNGVLCVGQPNYTGSKTNEGRIHKLNWTGSGFIAGTPITLGVRVGYIGTCLGWDAVSDYLVFGYTSDNLHTMSEAGGQGPILDGARSSRLGELFAMGDSWLIAWDADYAGPRLYELTSSWVLRNTGSTYAYGTYSFGGTYHPLGRSGARSPFIVMTDGSSNYVGTYKDSSNFLHVQGGSVPLLACGRSTDNELRLVGWRSQYVHSALNESGNWSRNPLDTQQLLSDTVDSNVPSSICTVCYDGVEEYLVYFITSSTRLNKNYNVVHLTKSNQPHIQVGRHYLLSEYNVSSGDSVSAAGSSYSNVSIVYKTGVLYFLQIDGDPLYYVPDGVGGLVSYTTVEDAKVGAADISTWDTYMPTMDIASINILRTYIILEKALSETYPLEAPSISWLMLELQESGIPEPELCVHFENGERVKQVRRDTSNVLTVVTHVGPQAEAVGVTFTGQPFRRLT